jgi:hypothetical protein
MNFCPGEYDAGASPASTRGGTTQHHNAPFELFWNLKRWHFLTIFLELIETLKKFKCLGTE